MIRNRCSARIWGSCWSLYIATVITTPAAVQAQSETSSVGILRATGTRVPAQLADAVDQALLRDLAELASIDHPTVSPVSYEAVQLAVGCEGESPDCLSSIAQTLQTDTVMVRRLEVDALGATTLELIYFEVGGQREVASAQASVPAGSQAEITATTPRLVRELFGLSEPPAAAPVAPVPLATQPAETAPETSNAEPQDAEHRDVPRDDAGSVGPWTWVMLISGTVVLGTGIILGVTAASSFEDLKQTNPRTRADAEGVHRDFEPIEARATVANILMPVGGAALALGAVLLVLDLSEGDESAEHAASRVDLVPLRGGAVITLSGPLGNL